MNFAPGDESLEPEIANERRELRQALADAVDSLTPRESLVLQMRFGFSLVRRHDQQIGWHMEMHPTDQDGMTLDEVGAAFGVTRERIRQIESQAIRKLKHPSRSGRTREAAGI